MDYPLKRVIPLTIFTPHHTNPWTNITEVLFYLLQHPEVRHQIIAEVQQRSNGAMCNYLLYHPLFRRPLFLHPHEGDRQFLRTIQNLLFTEAWVWIEIPELDQDIRYSPTPI